jgi:hypothetical protein
MSRRKVIATRSIPLTGLDGQSGNITVTVYLPFEDDGMWCCKYRIVFPDERKERVAYGKDTLQALLLAIDGLQAEVLGIEKRRNIKLDWDGVPFVMPDRLKEIWS